MIFYLIEHGRKTSYSMRFPLTQITLARMTFEMITIRKLQPKPPSRNRIRDVDDKQRSVRISSQR